MLKSRLVRNSFDLTIKTSKSAAALSSSHRTTAADMSSSSSTCPDQSARSEVNDGDRQQIEAALASVTKLISNLDAEVSTSHDVQMLVNLVKHREEIIAAQLDTLTDFQELISHHHSLVNVMDNQVVTIANLRQQLLKNKVVKEETKMNNQRLDSKSSSKCLDRDWCTLCLQLRHQSRGLHNAHVSPRKG